MHNLRTVRGQDYLSSGFFHLPDRYLAKSN